MIATLELTERACRAVADQYLATMLGTAYHAERGQLRNDTWVFTVINQRTDMKRIPAVGSIAVDATSGQIEALTDDQIRNMREAGAVQAAQERRELARDEAGYVLRRHARIKASCWISNRVGMKIGAEGGQLLAQEPPIWRFSIVCYLRAIQVGSLGSIDVDAISGQVIPLTDAQIQTIHEALSAAVRCQQKSPTKAGRLVGGLLSIGS